jgi:hypothetical protein
MDAVRRDVQPPAHEPGRPLDPRARVEHALPRRRELEPEILDDLRPEALGLFDREAMELVVAVAPEPAPEPHDVRPLDALLGGSPDELAHLGDPSPNKRNPPGCGSPGVSLVCT